MTTSEALKWADTFGTGNSSRPSVNAMVALAAEVRRLEEQLRLAEMAAADNADWFDNLVLDLSKILGCDNTPVVVLGAAMDAMERLRKAEGKQ